MPKYQKCKKGNCINDDTQQIDKLDEFNYDQEVFLKSVSGSVEAGMIESLLEAHGIPVLKKHKDAGGVYLEIYMGMSAAGIDLYVPSRFLEKAKEIVGSEIHKDAIIENYDENLNEKYIKKRRFRAWIILLFFVPGIIWLIISIVARIIQIIT